MNPKQKKDPTEIQAESFSAAGSAQNADFIADVVRSGDATGAVVQSVKLKRTKGKQEEFMVVTVEEIPSLIAILDHAQEKLIPATNAYGLPVVAEEGKKK